MTCNHGYTVQYQGSVLNNLPRIYEWCGYCGAIRTIEGTQLFPWTVPDKELAEERRKKR